MQYNIEYLKKNKEVVSLESVKGFHEELKIVIKFAKEKLNKLGYSDLALDIGFIVSDADDSLNAVISDTTRGKSRLPTQIKHSDEEGEEADVKGSIKELAPPPTPSVHVFPPESRGVVRNDDPFDDESRLDNPTFLEDATPLSESNSAPRVPAPDQDETTGMQFRNETPRPSRLSRNRPKSLDVAGNESPSPFESIFFDARDSTDAKFEIDNSFLGVLESRVGR